MINKHLISGAGVLLAVALSGCGAVVSTPGASTEAAAPSQAVAASPAPAAASPAASVAAVVAPTPTFEVVTDPEPSAAAVAANGNSAWRDQVLRGDSLSVAIENLPPPAEGEAYAAWLAGTDSSLPLGELAPVEGGPATLTYISPGHENLVGAYDRVYISKGAAADVGSKIEDVILAGQLPAQALVHVRHVLVSIPSTPAKLGFALGLRQESDELLRHAQFLKDAYDAGDLALEKVHAEHIINIIGGAQAEDFGDLNGDGKVQNPGDGFGLLPNGTQDGYIKGMVDHARLAAESPDATDNIKLHAGHVQVAGENTRARVQEIHDIAHRLLEAGAVADTQGDVLTILALSQQAIAGVDIDNDEQIAPVPGEGGVQTAYQHAQLMAGITLTPEAAEQIAAPPAQVAASAAAQQVAIDIADNSFTAAKITVPAGATIVWANTGQKKHTVTADDGSFDSGTLEQGATFTHTFDQPGTFQYYCTFHGAAGGQGMSATIVVVEPSAAAQPSAAAPPAAAAQPSPDASAHGHASPAAQASAAPSPTAAPAQAAPAPATIDVAIGDNSFTQQELSVPVGSTVVWTQAGQRPHTVTADDGSFDSDTMETGATFKRTFDAPGVYAYYCVFHGGPGGVGMSGVIRVK